MPRFDTGKVVRILQQRRGLARLLIDIKGEERRATAFTNITGPISEGDGVVVNTTGVDLELGTGGEDFVLWNLELTQTGARGARGGGHILKLRYTPWQIDTLSAEAPESPHHAALASAESLEDMPVIACGLHSQVPAAAAMIRDGNPNARVAYVMTDGAALPILHSDLVAALKARGLIDVTITCGHAFGGDLECVNVYSALATARVAAKADVTLVSMGPGIVGTDTILGHTGMEQGQVLSAAGALGGRPIAVLRITFEDPRERHRVVSHHTLSALRLAALTRIVIAVPRLDNGRLSEVMRRLEEAGLTQKHEIRVVDGSSTIDTLRRFDITVSSMGRTPSQDPEFFQAAGAAGIVARDMLEAG